MQTIQGYSVAGTGLVLRGIRRRDDGTPEQPSFEVTRWLALFFVPLIPLRRWKAVYLGEAVPRDMNMDRSLQFGAVERLPINPLLALKTFGVGILALAVAFGPLYLCLRWIDIDTNDDLVVLFKLICLILSIFWPLIFMLWCYNSQRHRAEAQDALRPQSGAAHPA